MKKEECTKNIKLCYLKSIDVHSFVNIIKHNIKWLLVKANNFGIYLFPVNYQLILCTSINLNQICSQISNKQYSNWRYISMLSRDNQDTIINFQKLHLLTMKYTRP